jgi:hypothetical protein
MPILRPNQMVDSWFALLEDCAGSSDSLFPKVKTKLEAIQPPNVRYREEKVSSGFWASLTGKGRQFLMVVDIVPALKEYKFYITSEHAGPIFRWGGISRDLQRRCRRCWGEQ